MAINYTVQAEVCGHVKDLSEKVATLEHSSDDLK